MYSSLPMSNQFAILTLNNSSGPKKVKSAHGLLAVQQCSGAEKHGNSVPLSSSGLIKPVTCCLCQSQAHPAETQPLIRAFKKLLVCSLFCSPLSSSLASLHLVTLPLHFSTDPQPSLARTAFSFITRPARDQCEAHEMALCDQEMPLPYGEIRMSHVSVAPIIQL